MLYDLIIRGGFIVDGTGNPGFLGDIAIGGDRVVHIATTIEGPAKHEIDATHKVVAPGFIDPHAHMELMLFTNPTLQEYAFQGVTTIINGNCGHSVTPYGADTVIDYMHRNGLLGERQMALDLRWTDFAGYRQAVRDNGGTALNHGTLLGHGMLRWAVMKGAFSRAPGPAELNELRRLVAEGMEQGALGMSSGLDYLPAAYASTGELAQLAHVVGQHDGVYASHTRHSLGDLEAVREAVEIGREAKCRVQVSHLNLLSLESYAELLRAREQGVEVAVDTIPASAGHIVRKDRMVQFIRSMSPDYFDLNLETVVEAMHGPAGRRELAETEPLFSEEWDSVFVVNTNQPGWEGRSLAELARYEGHDDVRDLVFDLLLDPNLELSLWMDRGGTQPSAANPPESISNPFVGAGGDILFPDRLDPFGWYEVVRQGTFPRFLELGRGAGLMLEELVRRITSLPAQTFRLRDIGLLTEGKLADVVVFDLERFDYPNRYGLDYSQPVHLATGVEHLLVGGRPVISSGELVEGARPGRQLVSN